MSDVNYGISNVGTVMTACAGSQAGQLGQYHAKLDRVKFGAPLEQVCRPDLPGPLLVSSDQGASILTSIKNNIRSNFILKTY